MSTMSGLIPQKYYNASIPFFEISPTRATANDGSDLWSWVTAVMLVPKIISDSELKETHGSIYYGFLSCHVP